MVGKDVCAGCGSKLAAIEGPTHAYMLSSPACWAAFNEVMAREYSNPQLLHVHRLSVDAWAVQHRGDGSRQAIQSVGLHLARLMIQIEQRVTGDKANAAMLRFAVRKAELPELPARDSFKITVADVVDAVAPDDHERAVRRWAETTWLDWADQHEFIRSWISQFA
jgi:uncharacterized protein DUF5946